MLLRSAAFAALALSSTVFGQYITPVSENDDSYLIVNGMADCLDALGYINDDSVDTTTIGTGATRTIEGIVPVPTTETGSNSPIVYAATITRLTTVAVTTLVISDLCTFKFDCATLGSNYNFSCTYDVELATPSYNFNDTFYGTATDNNDLATTWPDNGSTTMTSSTPATNGLGPTSTPASQSPTGPWPYPTATTPCPICPTTTVTVTSTVPCPVCPGGVTVTFIEQCLTLPTNWFELVPITTRTVTEQCDCADKGGTTIYVVTEPCGPISTTDCPESTITTECEEPVETEDCDCEEEEETTSCEQRPIVYAVPTTSCATTPVTPVVKVTSTPTSTKQSLVVFRSESTRIEASSWLLWTIIGLVLGVVV